MKVNKGDLGYIKAQKKKRTWMTVGLFALPLAIFFTGLWQTGTRLNLFTFVAIMGCLPAARCAVGMVMILIQKPVEETFYRDMEKRAGNLARAYELVISAYEKNTPIDGLVICGYHVVGYTSSQKADVAFVQKHIQEILKGNGYRSDVKIFKDVKPFMDRVAYLAKNQEEIEKDISFTPNESYPDLTRSQLVKHTILAISL